MNRPRILFCHPHGPPFAKHAAKSFVEHGYDARVVTAVGFTDRVGTSCSKKTIASRFSARLARRAWIPPGVSITNVAWPEVLRMAIAGSNLGMRFGIHLQGLVDGVYEAVDRRAAELLQGDHSLVYGYEDGALHLFRRADELGVSRIYDLPIMHWRQALEVETAEAARFPELATALLTLQDSTEKHHRKDEELGLATRIVVASELTRRSLVKSGVDSSRISVVPYGVTLPPTPHDPNPNDLFRVLFVGRVGPRKGIHRLLSVWNRLGLPNSELCLAGVDEFPRGYLSRILGSARHLGHLSADKLAPLYQRASLFVLPSLVEGFGLVLLEALAHGAPILASNHTAAPEILEDHRCGWSFPYGDEEALCQRLLYAYENRAELHSMRPAARSTAATYSWARYRKGIAREVSTLFGDPR